MSEQPNHSIAIRCDSVTKKFQDGESSVIAVENVDWEIECNQLILLVGPSGCGKTTLLSLISGILEPTKGSIDVFQRNLTMMKTDEKTEFRRKYLGFVFQNKNLFPTLTARENVSIPLILNGVSRDEALIAADDMLEQVGLQQQRAQKPRTLSGGEQQRVAIARALIHDPRLIICDEPTASLDIKTGKSIFKLLRSTGVKPNRATIVVTHDSRLFSFGDMIATMDDGALVDFKKVTEAEPTGLEPK